MRSQKRGGIAITTIVELGIVILLAIAFMNATGLLTNEDQLTSLYLARDVAQLTNVFQTTGYDISYDYPIAFDQRNILLENNLITVVQDDEETIAGQTFSFTDALFIPSEYFLLPKKITLDAAFFSINKIGKGIIFKDGTLASDDEKTLDDVLNKKTPLKKDIIVHVSYESDELFKEQVLVQLQNNIKTQLHDQGFVLDTDNTPQTDTSNKEDVHIVLFIDDDVQKNSIYYSSSHKIETQPLSDEINRLVGPLLDFNDHSFEMIKGESDSTIEIHLSSQDETMNKLQESKKEYKGMRLSFAKRIALGFNNYYSE